MQTDINFVGVEIHLILSATAGHTIFLCTVVFN